MNAETFIFKSGRNRSRKGLSVMRNVDRLLHSYTLVPSWVQRNMRINKEEFIYSAALFIGCLCAYGATYESLEKTRTPFLVLLVGGLLSGAYFIYRLWQYLHAKHWLRSEWKEMTGGADDSLFNERAVETSLGHLAWRIDNSEDENEERKQQEIAHLKARFYRARDAASVLGLCQAFVRLRDFERNGAGGAVIEEKGHAIVPWRWYDYKKV